MTFTRRQALGILAALPAGIVVGCSTASGSRVGEPTDRISTPLSATPEYRPAPEPEPEPAPPHVEPLSPESSHWLPGPREIAPEIKRTAAAFLETAGTWLAGTGAVGSLNAAGARESAAQTATVLDTPDAIASTLRMVYPQYGGLAGHRAAVIALFDQDTELVTGDRSTRQIALDLRLSRSAEGAWGVDRINPLTSLSPPVALSYTAQSVLAEPRITLSGPAALDVSTGRISDALLHVLLGLAREYTLAVQVMHTGHIQTVFPTERTSNHAVGRAVDIREINGINVVSREMPSDVVADFMQRAAWLGATEVGGPFDLNGDRPGFFSDDVHQDHIHVGITPGLALAHLR
ncbi:hypothetical protein [Hoyosella altamirensis]|uniref:Uncharacterized protein n=1 Tax=Hoyosella altamirensis TaxID=616997 RepID=A0A839RKG6_9ACTN|nr:hypothetical protein [Hoyosella altamirensis]MBB3036664.1 hypothetical protein [Hoyosella altamirensis]